MPATRRKLEFWAGLLAGSVLALSLAVLLLGWGTGIGWLVRMGPGNPAMVPGTAICLAATAAAQLLQLGPRRRRRPGAARALAGAVLAFSALRLAVAVPVRFMPGAESGDRMALATSAGLAIAALGTLAAGSRGRLADRAASAIGAAGLLLTLTAIGTYLIDRGAYEATLAFTGMAPHSALSLLALCTAAMLARPDFRLARIAFGEGTGSRAARRLVPLALLGPLLLAELAVEISGRGVLDPSVWSSGIAAALAILSVLAVLNVADLRNREERLRREEERRMRAALDGLDAAVFVFGADRRFRMANRGARRLCGTEISPESWLFRARFHALGDRRSLPPGEAPARRLLDGGAGGDLHAGWVDPEGTEHALRFCLRPQPGGDLLVLSVIDETQGWILRENLARTERLDAVGEMAGGIAHEMANIFGVVQLSADTGLLSGREETMQRHLGGIQAACARGADLTDRLLALTREPAAGTGTSDLRRVLEEAGPVLRAVLPATIGLAADCPGTAPLALRAPAADLEAALLNLVLNARNAIVESGAAGGQIAIAARADGMLELSVADDGPGMDPAVLARARDPFFSTRLARGGSGLGLAMVENFARRCGGTLEIASAPGMGTRATLRLPPADEAEAAPGSAAEPLPDLAGRSILVVDDDPGMTGLVSEILAMLGAEVSHAGTGAEAMELLNGEGAFDLLVTDLVLPGSLGGNRLAAAARRARPHLRVLYLTGYAGPAEPGGQEVPGLVLRKPAGARDLANAVALSLGS
ncbi:ATP-binding protein [Mangrovicoccus sp. HB161399]|uniref:ATP-binding response regulator n=1 Tax=Mangrovicoccus sp. HB161399 TaxID=2720392 RepID=UPI001556905C|nr:ATP-binding protein [Mangrovicoccus sp. HB161399]